MAQHPSNRKVKGQAARTARLLFGKVGAAKMESPEEREHMAIVLSRSSDARVQQLVTDLMLQPETSLAKLAEGHALNYHEISEEYTRLRKAEGFIRAAHHIPEIMEQVAEDAKNRWIECGACSGLGKVDMIIPCEPCEGKKGNSDCEKCAGKGKHGDIVDCPTCSGKGQVYIQASVDHLKLMFDTFGLTGKGGGVNVNLDLRKTSAGESLGDLANTLGPILEGDGK